MSNFRVFLNELKFRSNRSDSRAFWKGVFADTPSDFGRDDVECKSILRLVLAFSTRSVNLDNVWRQEYSDEAVSRAPFLFILRERIVTAGKSGITSFSNVLKRSLLLVSILILLPFSAVADDWSTFDNLVSSLHLNANVTDLSDYGSIQIDEPRIAYVNITGFSNMPSTQISYAQGWMEVYDGHGNYFRKRIRIHGQGGYSIRYPKKNFTLKFCENDYTEEVTTDVQIGDWVVQSGFHFKAFWTDFSRGIGEIGYKMFSLMVADRTPYWERGGYIKDSKARCFPDGFPCAVYLNGNFYGIFAWQLMKHRRNMNMKKSETQHVHLDGNVNDNYLFRGKISWTQFCVRNPKDLYAQSGKVYNHDSPAELMDANSSSYNNSSDSEEIREQKQRSAEVKRIVRQLSNYHGQLEAMEKNGASKAELKRVFAQMFDIESLVDYTVFYHFSANGDGTLKNWQWFTYDGVRWMVTPYDLDQTFGLNLYAVIRPANFAVSELTNGPFYWLDRYFKDEIIQRYKELRLSGVLTASTLVPIVTDWCERVGDTFYAMEKSKWPDSPCYCESICNYPWQVCNDWSLYSVAPSYNASAMYQPGDVCKLEGRLWQATSATQGSYPFFRNANIDTQERLEAWIPARLEYLDEKYGVTIPPVVSTPVIADNPDEVVGIYTLSGMRVSHPTSAGVYIYKYKNGATRKVSLRH